MHDKSLKELCGQLSISIATGRNWVKLGKITPQYIKNGVPYFDEKHIVIIENEIRSGKNVALKSRRNKKYVSGNALYRSYVSQNCKNLTVLQKLLSAITWEQILLTSDVISYFVADCALQLFGQKPLFFQYLQGKISIGKYDILLDALIGDRQRAMDFCQKYPAFFAHEYIWEPGEDILGLIYLSCKNMGSRKARGSYYTPTKVVKKLISHLDIEHIGKVLDPCCGTGNFLLQLPESVDLADIYGTDTDAVSIRIARLNMALKYPDADVEEICEHITEKNFLTEYDRTGFDTIIGNPPWGYAFSNEDKAVLKARYATASGRNTESYDVFIERALEILVPDGTLAFVLPEAVLNVKAHMRIRTILLQGSSVKSLTFLGDMFDGVQCPCILLQLIATGKPLSTAGMMIEDRTRTFIIAMERTVVPENFSFRMTDEEYRVLEKIKNSIPVCYLANHADFALGIVTGNNKKFLSTEKTEHSEMVLKGTDICKYHINPAKQYLRFEPEQFQQVAPLEIYRAPEKLLYRFISNQLVVAYDDRQMLSLNSCNIVIPKIEGMQIKYILAILNSSVSQFVYQKEFHSIKVLRAHMEHIPIPRVGKAIQNEIIAMTEPLIHGMGKEAAETCQKRLDCRIMDLFRLSAEEQWIIRHALH